MATNFRIALAVAVLAVAPAALADEPTISASQPVFDAPAAAGNAAPTAVVVEAPEATAASAQAQVVEWDSTQGRGWKPAPQAEVKQP
jgi:hypothetical protein